MRSCDAGWVGGDGNHVCVGGWICRSVLQGAGGIGGLLLQDTGTATRLYTYEANGNVGQLVDGTTGAVVAHYGVRPFGTTLTASGTAAAANPFRFSTKYTDTEDRSALLRLPLLFAVSRPLAHPRPD